MMRCARVAMLLAGTLCLSAASARAQSAPAGPASQYSAELSVGPTLGHQSAGFVSGEFDWRLTDKLDVFVEAGHMGNVGTSALDSNAGIIATFLGASVGSTSIKVNHVDFGVRVNINPLSPMIHPYALFGAGFARATTEVTFTVNGNVIDPSDRVALGGDLSGTNTKAILMFGGGITMPFAERYFADIGYRFGGILSKISDIENDVTIKTQRITIGAGIKF